MKHNIKNKLNINRGFTLIELIVSLALLVIVIGVVTNLLLHGLIAYETISEGSLISNEIQPTMFYLEQDIRQARKPSETEDSIVRDSSKKIRVYRDINNDGKPEEITYEVINKQLTRSYKVSKTNKYPYTFSGGYANSKILLENIKSPDIFDVPEKVTVPANQYAPPDYRRKIKISIEIENTNSRGGDIKFEKYLMSRSRVEAD